MDTDTVAGMSFPKHYAASTLDLMGSDQYFISGDSRQVLQKRDTG